MSLRRLAETRNRTLGPAFRKRNDDAYPGTADLRSPSADQRWPGAPRDSVHVWKTRPNSISVFQTRPPGPLMPPPPSGRTNTCIDRRFLWEGIDRAACHALALDDPRSICDLLALDFSGMDQKVKLVGGDAIDRDFARHAWAVLLDNLDLVEWAICLYLGSALDARPATHMIDRRWPTPRVNVKFDGNGWSATPDLGGGGVIHVDSTGGLASPPVGTWQRARFAAGSPNAADRACGLIDTAATFFHELLHLPGAGDIGFGIAGPDSSIFETACEASYQIENAFRWAMWRRFPETLSSPCCAFPASDLTQLFGSNDPQFLLPNCTGSLPGTQGPTC